VTGMTFKDVLTTESFDRALTVLERGIGADGLDMDDMSRPDFYELELIRKDGTRVFAEVTSRFMADEGGKVSGVIGVTRDITERKRSEERLIKSESRYRLLAENVTDVIWTMDRELGFTFASPSVRSMLGYSADEFMRLSLREVMTPGSYDYARETFERGVRDGPESSDPLGAVTFETEQIRKDGARIWVEVTSNVLVDSAGEPGGLIAVCREITDRKLAERALLESEERLDGILGSLEDLVWSSDANTGSLIYVNGAVERIHGLSMEEVGANRSWWIDAVHPDDLGELDNYPADLISTGHAEAEFRVVRPDGGVRWVRDRTRLIRDESGLPLRIDSIGADITVQKEIERELADQQAKMISADRLRSLGEMATAIAHELNQPLMGVRGQAEHLLIGMDKGWEFGKDKIQSKLSTILDQSDRMVHIIEHVRKFARGADSEELGEVGLNEVVNSSASLIGAQLRSRGISLELDLAGDLPSVWANPFSLEEVALNLISNARDSTLEKAAQGGESGSLSIELRTAVGDDGSGTVRLLVIDHGVGFEREVATRAFDPFFTTKGLDEGTGLGLSITRQIVDDAGGEVVIEDTPGGGATLVVSLPAMKRNRE